MSDTPKLPRRVAPSAVMERLRQMSDARVGLGQAGEGLPTAPVLRFALDHARARDAIQSDMHADRLAEAMADGPWPLRLTSQAEDRQTYLTRPDLGRRLSPASVEHIAQSGLRCDLAIVLADGLSAAAVNLNALPVIEALRPLLGDEQTGSVLLRNGRVAAGDQVALALGAKAVVVLIGERPGLSASDSLGAYVTWSPRADTRDSERFCVSNIRSGGLPADEAARQIADLLKRSRLAGRSGVAISG